MTREQLEHMMLMGMRFGYPICCIRTFLNKPLSADRPWPNPWEGTGYAPCEVCAAEPMMTVQGRINARRDTKLPPFPSEKV